MPRVSYADPSLLRFDRSTNTFTCVSCMASDFTRGSHNMRIRQLVIRCVKCDRRWRVNRHTKEASLQAMPFRENRGQTNDQRT